MDAKTRHFAVYVSLIAGELALKPHILVDFQPRFFFYCTAA